MCRAIRCESCGKTGWTGCGAHVEQVMANVPESDRCHCRDQRNAEPSKPSWVKQITNALTPKR